MSTDDMICAGRSCLVLVDIQEKLAAAIPQKVMQRIEKNTQRLVSAADKLDIPIIATLQYPKGLGPLTANLGERLPPNARTIEKTAFSCMAEATFRDHLASLSRLQVILPGMETHICILQTALELKAAGYQPWVVMDATGSRIRDNYNFSLSRMRHNGVQIISTESILFEWLRDSRHPAFKDISALITEN